MWSWSKTRLHTVHWERYAYTSIHAKHCGIGDHVIKNKYWIYGFDSSKINNSKLNFSQKSVLVFGSEGKGIRELVKKECDEIIQINMKNNLKFEIDSLNVSNATSIALYQFYSS